MKIQIFKNDIPDDLLIKGDLAIDTESMGLEIKRDRLCVVQIADDQSNAYLVQFERGNYQAPNLKKLLLDPERCKIFHFARFDISMIKHYLQVDLENIFCTRLASKLARTYTDSHSLREICRELLGVNITKDQQCSDWGGDELDKKQQEYAAKDVIYLHALRDALLKRLQREERLDIAKKLFAFLPARCELDLIGWDYIDIFEH